MKNAKRRILKKAVKAFAHFCASAMIILICARFAYIERGYFAVGGEVLIPLLIYTVCKLIETIKEFEH